MKVKIKKGGIYLLEDPIECWYPSRIPPSCVVLGIRGDKHNKCRAQIILGGALDDPDSWFYTGYIYHIDGLIGTYTKITKLN